MRGPAPADELSNSNALPSILSRRLSSSLGWAAHHPSPRLYFLSRGPFRRSPIPPSGDGPSDAVRHQDPTGRKGCRRQGVWNLLGPGTPGTSRAARPDGRGTLGALVPGVHHPAELVRKDAPRGVSCASGVSHPLGLPFTLQSSLQPRTSSPRPPLNLGRFLLPLGKPPSRSAGFSASQTAPEFTRCLATLAGKGGRPTTGAARKEGNLEHVTR